MQQNLRDAFVGTTAERTIRAVRCPVLMVNGPPAGPWRHVLVTTDLSEHAEKALTRFARSGLGTGARLSVLTAFDAPALRLAMSGSMGHQGQQDYLDGLRAEARQALAEFMSRSNLRHAERIVRHDATGVATEILKTADEEKADLIVVAIHGKRAFEHLVLGSVAQQVLKDTQTDILTWPAEPG